MKQSNLSHSRRGFLKKSALGSVTSLCVPDIVSSLIDEKLRKVTINQGDVVLFQGDSITDAGRNKDDQSYNTGQALGSGYTMLAGAALLGNHAKKELKVYNRGISGNKVYQLAERWEDDALKLKPNVLSILIGVNDFWHTLTNNYKGTVTTYKDDFSKLLERTTKQIPSVKLIIGEPFAVRGVKAVDDTWYPAFDAYRKAAKEIADKFDAVFIPYQSIFDEAQKSAPASYWTADGVHPTLAGNELMAQAWLKTIQKS